MRFIAAQFKAYFNNDLWKRNAEHSNAMAKQLHNAIKDEKGVEVVYPVQANGVFVRLPREVWTRLQEKYFFYDWDEDDNVVRFMCSFDTTTEDIVSFADTLKELLGNYKWLMIRYSGTDDSSIVGAVFLRSFFLTKTFELQK